MAKTKQPLNLDDAQKQIIQFIEERDWSQFHNPKDLARNRDEVGEEQP